MHSRPDRPARQRGEDAGAAREVAARERALGAAQHPREGGAPERPEARAHPRRGVPADEGRCDVRLEQPLVDEDEQEIVQITAIGAVPGGAGGAARLGPRRPVVRPVQDDVEAFVELRDALFGEGLGGRQPAHRRRGPDERGRDAEPRAGARRRVIEQRPPERGDARPRRREGRAWRARRHARRRAERAQANAGQQARRRRPKRRPSAVALDGAPALRRIGRRRQASAREADGHSAEHVRRERARPSPVALTQQGRPQQERRQRLVHRRYTNSTATAPDKARRPPRSRGEAARAHL